MDGIYLHENFDQSLLEGNLWNSLNTIIKLVPQGCQFGLFVDFSFSLRQLKLIQFRDFSNSYLFVAIRNFAIFLLLPWSRKVSLLASHVNRNICINWLFFIFYCSL